MMASSSADFLARFKQKYAEIQPVLPLNCRPVVAYSGGVDSQVLLGLLHVLGTNPVAVHVNHQLQKSAATFQSHCESFCKRNGIEFVPLTVDVPNQSGSLEADARHARYLAIFQWMIEHSLQGLWLGHHQDDQVETILVQLFRGSGIRGLSGMQTIAPAGVERSRFPSIRLIRPLLNESKIEILGYAKEMGGSWVEDPSNQDQVLRRNWIRQSLLPDLATHFPQARSGILKLADHIHHQFSVLDEALAPTMDEITGEEGELLLTKWRALDENESLECLKAWLAASGIRCSKPKLLELSRQLGLPKGGKRQVAKGWSVETRKGLAWARLDN